ncbi:hypothetical protein CJ204_09350 [Corynebacterium xerosis]|uniref:Uncharacterized protein n=1 Tax=Corynebacterium xerosis TaxID=1725 RepID=A0A2N6SXJ7_9CORY|nr:hypothetical protein CJ204_09350 [Corynebacterium xerosis]
MGAPRRGRSPIDPTCSTGPTASIGPIDPTGPTAPIDPTGPTGPYRGQRMVWACATTRIPATSTTMIRWIGSSGRTTRGARP